MPWPDGLAVDFENIDVGIARTAPEYEDRRQIAEIEAATLVIIASARRTLYIESQYFASRTVAQAIADRLREDDGPEIVVVNPDAMDGWLEAETMDSARIRLMHLVRGADRHDRFRLLYPVNEAGSPIYVHAKIMIADDRILKLGSANLNNRSMGYDTECDLVIECKPGNAATAQGIRLKRDGPLAEHLGRSPEAVAAAIDHYDGSLIAAIEEFNGPGRRLVPVPTRALTSVEKALAESDTVDPERPANWRDTVAGFLRRA